LFFGKLINLLLQLLDLLVGGLLASGLRSALAVIGAGHRGRRRVLAVI
jgi:hypothetical protein